MLLAASVFGLLSSLLAGLTPVRLGLAPVLFGGVRRLQISSIGRENHPMMLDDYSQTKDLF